jgi:hypothetical protein
LAGDALIAFFLSFLHSCCAMEEFEDFSAFL